MNEAVAFDRLTFVCDQCGAPAFSVYPGSADKTCDLLGTTLVLKRGVSSKAWCEEHWRENFGVSDEARRQIADCSWRTNDSTREFSLPDGVA